MRHQKALTLLALVVACVTPGLAAHTSARLLVAAEQARSGETVMAAVELTMEPGWHTYWRNSGASGMPTSIDWELPPGISAGEIQWPLAEKLPEGELTTYTYSGRVLLLVPLHIGTNTPSGEKQLRAKVSWLECEKLCLPGDATVQATLVIDANSRASTNSALLADWMRRVPQPAPEAEARAYWPDAPQGDIRTLVIAWKRQSPGSKLEGVDFLPYASDTFEVQPDTVRLDSRGNDIRIQKAVKKLSGDWPNTVQGVLVESSEGKRQGFEVTVEPAAKPAGEVRSLALMLLYAFLGGLILNIMPCVLPVISLKILGFVNSSNESPSRVRNMGLVYAAGVLFSFLVLAGIVIGVKAAGQSAGWGMQFGNPYFIVALGTLISLVALNLFGLFEVNPGGRVLDTAGSLASRQGTAGAFFNGVLATILATPCTAPFLGAALGFAFLQSASVIVLIFAMAALGLASPYVLLSWNPKLLSYLPKPGAWMERFKVAMGFPMLITAVWLASLLQPHYGARSWWFGVFLAIVALAAWIYGEFIQRSGRHRGLAGAAILLVLGAAYWLILERQLQWRAPLAGESAGLPRNAGPGEIDWQKWSPEALAAARGKGHPVLVDFTADWCLTCQANKKFAIEIPQVRAKLKEINAVALLGDYTRLPPLITQELNRHGRAGVPLVLVYPREPSAPPIVLPEALTPGIVVNALEQASR